MECGWPHLGFILRGARVEYLSADVSLSDTTFSPTGNVRVAESGLRFFALFEYRYNHIGRGEACKRGL